MKRPPKLLLPLGFLLLAACSGGGGGGGGTSPGGGEPTPVPGSLPAPPFTAGLSGATAGSGLVNLTWTLPGSGFQAALFQAPTRDGLYAAGPIQTNLSGTGATISVPNGTAVYFGLGVRPVGGGSYSPAGVPLFARPAPPIYVDASAAAGGNGTSPAAAFNDLFPALLTAFAAGGGNIWIRDGAYSALIRPVGSGVALYGGFDGSFTVENRDPKGTGTVVKGAGGGSLFDVLGEPFPAVFDGLVLDGQNVTPVGIDIEEAHVDIRNVTVRRFADRGIRLRNNSLTNDYEVTVASSSSSFNGADGLSMNGPYDLFVYGSSFDSNVQEGIELDAQIALENRTAQLVIRGSRFVGNGSEGVDAHLAAPLIFGPGGARFDVEISSSRFELNGLTGLRIDHEFEATPGWKADTLLQGVVARANGAHGIEFDADGPGRIQVARARCTANQLDGLHVSSESEAGIAVVSTSLFGGNLGRGLRAAAGLTSPQANRAVLATHCVFTGNAQGGFVSEVVTGAVASSVAYLQPNAWSGVRVVGCETLAAPLPSPFRNAAEAFDRVVGRSDVTLTLASGLAVEPSSVVELADDGVGRDVSRVAGNAIDVLSTPEVLRLPAALAVFAPGAEAEEDLRLSLGSQAEGAGMTPPGGPSVDAGIYGAPVPGTPGEALEVEPGRFLVVNATPAPGRTLGAEQAITLRLDRDVSPASVPGEVRVFVQGGAELTAFDVLTVEKELVLQPHAGWGEAEIRVEIHRGLRSTDDVGLTTPVTLIYRPI